MNRPEPPETAVAAMILLTALAMALVLLAETLANYLR